MAARKRKTMEPERLKRGTRVRYQVEGMPAERVGVILEVHAGGYLILSDRGSRDLVPFSAFCVADVDLQSGGAAPMPPAGAEPAPAPGTLGGESSGLAGVETTDEHGQTRTADGGTPAGRSDSPRAGCPKSLRGSGGDHRPRPPEAIAPESQGADVPAPELAQPADSTTGQAGADGNAALNSSDTAAPSPLETPAGSSPPPSPSPSAGVSLNQDGGAAPEAPAGDSASPRPPADCAADWPLEEPGCAGAGQSTARPAVPRTGVRGTSERGPGAVTVPGGVAGAAPLASSLPALTAEIRELIATGRRAATRIAVLLAQAHDAHFENDAGAWLKWAEREFGYNRRHCFTCLSVGRLLVRHVALLTEGPHSVHHVAPDLESVDMYKLEIVAAIRDDEMRAAFLKRIDLHTISRDALRKKVAKYIADDAPDVRTAGEDEDQERAVKKLTGPSPIMANLKALAYLAENDTERAAAAALITDAMPAFRAGFAALDMALDAVTLGLPMTGATFAVCSQLVADVALKLKELETTAAKRGEGENAANDGRRGVTP